MNKERMREILKRLRDFILCCKKTVDELHSFIEDINDLQQIPAGPENPENLKISSQSI